MGKYGIILSKTGYDIDDPDIRNILMSSEYSMLKYHSDNSASITLHHGDTSKYVDIPHNLGYVPAFIVYYELSSAVNRIFNINAFYTSTLFPYTTLFRSSCVNSPPNAGRLDSGN